MPRSIKRILQKQKDHMPKIHASDHFVDNYNPFADPIAPHIDLEFGDASTPQATISPDP